MDVYGRSEDRPSPPCRIESLSIVGTVVSPPCRQQKVSPGKDLPASLMLTHRIEWLNCALVRRYQAARSSLGQGGSGDNLQVSLPRAQAVIGCYPAAGHVSAIERKPREGQVMTGCCVARQA